MYEQLQLVWVSSSSVTWTASGQNLYSGFLSSWVFQYHNTSKNISYWPAMALFTPVQYQWVPNLHHSNIFNETLLVFYDMMMSPHITFQFNNIVQVIFLSPATVAAIVALLLDCTLDRASSFTRPDSGRHWWGKFKSFHADTRSEEFYSLPYNLNKYFPSF